ncbi:MAG: VWA domain-containing protein, partial [Gemmatales bacterium]|nr:VWA domain-containing protein [Gemmatales bacterium]MDW8385973.1 VWA domain-containing protein [Gemmatales bacterium]
LWGRQPIPREPIKARDLYVVLDVSRSMLCEDAPPNRLARAKADLEALAEELDRRGGWRIGLIVFADRAAVLCPPTFDIKHFQEVLREADLDTLRLRSGTLASDRGTNLSAALARIRSVLSKANRQGEAFADVLLVSDGGDEVDSATRDAAEALSAAGVRIFCVGLGDPRRASPIPLTDQSGKKQWLTHRGETVLVRLEPETLRELARLTSGAYVAAETLPLPTARVVDLLTSAPRRELDLIGAGSEPIPRYRWFVFPALLLLVVESWVSKSARTTRGREISSVGRSPWLVRIIGPSRKHLAFSESSKPQAKGR